MKLLIGGSPCTHWSIAQTKNRETEASGIGWELFLNYRIARDKYQPDYFLYENNKSMSPAIRAQITAELGVEPVLINSALVSAQNRQRLYWAGKRNPDGTYRQVPVELPEDRGILLRDILETGFPLREKGYALQTGHGATAEDAIARRQRNAVAEPVAIKPLTEKEMEYMVRETKDGRNHFDFDYFHDATKDKSACVTANTHKGVPYNVLVEPIIVNGTKNGKSRTVDAHMGNLENNLVPRINNPNPAKQQYDCIAEPVRIGTIENDAKNPDHDSQQYRVYSPDGKSVTLCGNGGGLGAKTGLYATPITPPMQVNEATKLGYTVIQPGECVDLAMPQSKTRRGAGHEGQDQLPDDLVRVLRILRHHRRANLSGAWWNDHSQRTRVPYQAEGRLLHHPQADGPRVYASPNGAGDLCFPRKPQSSLQDAGQRLDSGCNRAHHGPLRGTDGGAGGSPVYV